ncbi:MAG TPA: TauD/TfdA family dioxygenase [Arenibaculum sp.]|nr:TauD/TfdA family dioxygenase [Arenibaculum sp.]
MSFHDEKLASRTAVAAKVMTDHIVLHWADGTASRFHFLWLRDNCRSPERFDVRTGERKALTEDIPADLRARDVRLEDGTVRVLWSDYGADSVFEAAWLQKNAYDAAPLPRVTRMTPWDANYGAEMAWFDYAEVMAGDDAAARMIDAYERYGLIRLAGVPCEDGEVERFADRIAYVREIAFDRVADIRVSADPYTLGFTDAALPLHTDCSGYSWPPNVMVFHCLRNEVAGGASQYVDGAQVVRQLRRRDPEALRILSEYDVEFRLWSKQADTLARCPPIILDDMGELSVLRYANWAVQPLRTVPFDLVPRWYEAWRALAERVNAPENRVSHRCEPGEILVVNNQRVLHGRDAFDGGQGMRHFQQVYMELDDLSGFRRIVQGEGGAR